MEERPLALPLPLRQGLFEDGIVVKSIAQVLQVCLQDLQEASELPPSLFKVASRASGIVLQIPHHFRAVTKLFREEAQTAYMAQDTGQMRHGSQLPISF